MYSIEYIEALKLFNNYLDRKAKENEIKVNESNKRIRDAHNKLGISEKFYKDLLDNMEGKRFLELGKYVIPTQSFFELTRAEKKALETVLINKYHFRYFASKCKIRKCLFKKAYVIKFKGTSFFDIGCDY